MDNGEEIQGLGEGWTFLGCKLTEWCAGIAMFLIVGELFFKGRVNAGMPLMLISGVATALGMMQLRKTFPDEEKGVLNFCCVVFGFNPPNIPTPSELQKHWGGLPHADLNPKCEFVKLGLNEMFFPKTDEAEVE